MRFRLLSELLRLIYPPFCVHCDDLLVGDERHLCTVCASQIAWATPGTNPGNLLESRLAGRIPFEAAAVLMIFRQKSVVQTIIHEIKYHGNLPLAYQFGRMLGEELAASGRFADIDLIVPVPLHRRRRRERGYNQSEEICRALAQVLNRPVAAHNLVRRRYTHTQTHKNRLDRYDNMQGVFAVRRPARFEGRHLLLVDDIVTTGATTEACFAALQHIPGLRISVASIAVTCD